MRNKKKSCPEGFFYFQENSTRFPGNKKTQKIFFVTNEFHLLCFLFPLYSVFLFFSTISQHILCHNTSSCAAHHSFQCLIRHSHCQPAGQNAAGVRYPLSVPQKIYSSVFAVPPSASICCSAFVAFWVPGNLLIISWNTEIALSVSPLRRYACAR